MFRDRDPSSRIGLWRVLALAACLGSGGCTYTGGKILYMLGFGREKVVEAEFRLTEEPVLILVDDFGDHVDWPAAKRYLSDELGQQLLKHSAAKKIIPQETIDRLRQSDPTLTKRSCREVGELAGAEQVLWIEVRDFLAEEIFDDVSDAAYFSVTVKVINVLEKERRSRVRLWPTGGEGRFVVGRLPGTAVAHLKSRDAISKALAGELAVEISKLFYDYQPDDF
ncbi:MAG: hypothetical protein ACYTFA_07075 [Planctomycetota bacterium]|jgi:hypothetical protein